MGFGGRKGFAEKISEGDGKGPLMPRAIRERRGRPASTKTGGDVVLLGLDAIVEEIRGRKEFAVMISEGAGKGPLMPWPIRERRGWTATTETGEDVEPLVWLRGWMGFVGGGEGISCADSGVEDVKASLMPGPFGTGGAAVLLVLDAMVDGIRGGKGLAALIPEENVKTSLKPWPFRNRRGRPTPP
jgi:hypothetical protein